MSNTPRLSTVVPPSATLAVKGAMAGLKAKGVDVISLGAGELGFPLAEDIKATKREIASDPELSQGYTDTSGMLPLRLALAFKANQDYNANYGPDNFVVTPAGKGALASLYATAFGGKETEYWDGRDEVIIPAPYWVSHPPIQQVLGGKPVYVQTTPESGYIMSAEQLEAAITDKTKFLQLTVPSNPTAAFLSDEHYKAYAAVLEKYPDVLVVTEDMYEHYVYDGQKRNNFLKACPEMADRLIQINCVSKSDEMAGARLGWVSGPLDIIKQIKSLDGNFLGNPPVDAQRDAIAAIVGHELAMLAYKDPAAFGESMKTDKAKQEFDRRSEERNTKVAKLEAWRDQVYDILSETDLIVPKPGGSFYMFPSLKPLFGRTFPTDLPLVDGLKEDDLEELGLENFAGRELQSAGDFAKAVATHGGIGIVPGDDFGAPDCFRIGYINERSVIAAGRMAGLIKTLK